MKKLNQCHFYYGAILHSIFESNPDATPALLQVTDKRSVYKIMTNTSKEYIAFCKYSTKNDNKSATYDSWKFAFTDDDKLLLEEYYKSKFPVFIYFLCAVPELKNSEIAVCTYEEYSVIKDKKTITIGREKHKSYFNLHTERTRESAIHLSRDRINKNSNDIIKEIEDFSPEHYNIKKNKIIVNTSNVSEPVKKQYERAISGQTVRYLSISQRDDNLCPIHNKKMESVYVHIRDIQDVVYYCKSCGKFIIPSSRYTWIIKRLKKNKNSVEFEVMLDNNFEGNYSGLPIRK